MRKFYAILSGIFLILVFTSCKQFTTNIDDYLTYWSSESYVNAHAVRTVHYNDKDNTLSVPSASDVTVMLTVHNPKNFSLVMPTSSADAGKIIRFPALSPQPIHGTDYILTQTANDKLNLTYKSSFLQAHEWGTRDIGAEITLSSKDGRTFKQNYRFKIRANTPPKLSYVTIGKTKDHDSNGKYYYVIILKAANMTKTAGTASELLHKDIKTLLITGKDPADIAFTTGNTGFTTNGRLLASAEVTQLELADLIGSAVLPNWDTALVNDPWALRYKTDTEVKTAEQIYKFKLGDEKGLVSNEISVSTAKTQVQDVRLFYNSSDISAQAGNFSTPYSINVEESDTSVTVTAKTEIAGAKITGEVEKWDGSTWRSVSDINSGAQNEVSIPLPTPTGSVQDILYKISVEAGGDGFAAGTVNTFYVNVTKSITVTIDGSAASAWKTLRNTVRDLRAGSTIIIKGEIKATNDADNFGEIVIDKNLTIKGSNKTTDKLNANKNEGPKQEHRIFKVESSATLTLSGLTLKGGICAVGEHNGGGIYAEGALTMTDCIVTDNETGYGNGGGIYAGGNLTMTRCTVSSNTVSDNSGVGGGIYIYQTGTYAMTDCTIDHNTAEYGEGGGIYAQGNLTMIGCTVSENTAKKSNGGGIYAGANLTMTGGAVTGNQAQFNGNGGGIYTKDKLDMTGVTLTGNKTASGDGGGIYLESGTLNMTNVTLTGNEAVNNKTGGAVYVNDGTFTMKGSSCITPSTGTEANARGKNDVYLAADSSADGKMITVEDELSPADGIAARITVSHFKYVTGTKVLDGSAVGTEYGKFTVTPETAPSQEWEVDSNGCLKKKGSGTSGTTINGSANNAWQALKTAVGAAQDGDVITIDGEIKATNTTGNNGEITISKNLTIRGKTGAASNILDANASNLNPSKVDRIFDVQGGTLTLENLTLKNGKKEGGLGGCIFVPSGKVELTDCIIENCTTGGGGAIGVKGEAKLTNTVIKKCEATSTTLGGGAIYTKGGKVTMTNCTLTGNKAKNGGAIYATKNTSPTQLATVTINGGAIGGTGADANEASKSGTDGGSGGGIYINNSTLKLQNNAKVIGNKASVRGGGIYVGDTDANFTMESGEISSNTVTITESAEIQGGGVCVIDGAKFEMKGGSIKNNTVIAAAADNAKARGGGVCVSGSGSTFIMKDGNPEIINNKVTKADGSNSSMRITTIGGGICVWDNAKFEMQQGTISGNKALKGSGINYFTGAGGGVCVGGGAGYINDTAEFKMSGGTISKNEASTNGGGVAVMSSAQFTMTNGTIGGSEADKNKASSNGGGVAVLHGTFEMQNGTVSYNQATGSSGSGGGVYGMNFNSNKGSIIIKGSSSISNNTAMSSGTLAGGGIDGSYKLTIVGDVKIMYNKAPNGFGGGIVCSQDAQVELKGCTVEGNTAKELQYGHGVFISSFNNTNTYFKMSGNTKIHKDNNVVLHGSSFITVTGRLSVNALNYYPSLTMNSDSGYSLNRVVVKSGGSYTLEASDISKFKVTPGGIPPKNWKIVLEGGVGKLKTDP